MTWISLCHLLCVVADTFQEALWASASIMWNAKNICPQKLQRGCRKAICKVPLGHKRQLIPISAPITHIMVWGQIQSRKKEGTGTRPRRRGGTSQWHWGWALCELPTCSLLADQVLPPGSEVGLTHTGKAGDGSGAQGPYKISEGQRGVGMELVHGSTQSVCVSHSSCLTLCDPMDCRLPGSSEVYGILQARILEWVVIPFSRSSSQPRDQTQVSCIADWFFTIWATREAWDHSVQFSSVTQSCPTLWDPMDCSMPGLPVHHQLPEFTQTHVHWVGDAIQPSHSLSSPSPPTFNLS